MELYATLRALIDANINTNGTQAITGAVHNDVMNQLLDALSVSEVYANPTLATNPGTPETAVAYIALPGVYPNFGGLEITAPLGILIWNGSPAAWSVVQLAFPSAYEYRFCKTIETLTALTSGNAVDVEMLNGGFTAKAGQWIQIVNRRTGDYLPLRLVANVASNATILYFVPLTFPTTLDIGSAIEIDPSVNMKWYGKAIYGDGVNNYIDMPTTWLPPPSQCTDPDVWISLIRIFCNGTRMFWAATPSGPLEFDLHTTNRYRIELDWVPTVNDRFDVELFQPRILV